MSEASPLVARVLPDVAGFERELDYLVPAGLAGEVRAGTIVRVPLQGRRVRGWVLAYPVPPTEGLALRPLAKVTGSGPEPELIELAFWAAWRWAGRRRSLLVTASPGTAVKRLPPSQSSQATVAPSEPVESRPTEHADGARPGASARDGALSARLVEEAWRPGVHLLRLPPVYSATEVVLAAAEHGPVVVVAPTTARAAAGCAALRNRGVDVALLPEDWAQARAGARVVIGTRAAAWALSRGGRSSCAGRPRRGARTGNRSDVGCASRGGGTGATGRRAVLLGDSLSHVGAHGGGRRRPAGQPGK